ncbi:MAG: pectin esterase [Saprospiraceae bacterium]|nr:pectin esterase [Saprospiraceae bacterium]
MALGQTPSYATRLVVAQDGSGDCATIQEAINQAKAFPDQRITIFIKKGVYREKVKVHAWNTLLTLQGEDPATTRITGDDFFDKINLGRNSTFYTATVLVQADDFRAENLSIENTAGPVGQAVALAVEADRCIFLNCRVLGHQDTLYVAGSNARQYFKNCYIEGTTDFIFGAATALFDSCGIHSKSNSYITAASTPRSKRFGMVFRHCVLSAAPGVDSVYLGRPWRDFARVVFFKCHLGAHILPEGWANWTDTRRDQTACFAEFNNSGPGAGAARRVPWSRRLSSREARQYRLAKILAPALPADDGAGSDWLRLSDPR